MDVTILVTVLYKFISLGQVILVTSAGPAPTVVQRSMSVPVVRSQPSPMSSVYPGLPASSSGGVGPGHVSAPRPSVIVSGASLPSSGVQQVVSAYPGVVTTTSGANLVSTTGKDICDETK